MTCIYLEMRVNHCKCANLVQQFGSYGQASATQFSVAHFEDWTVEFVPLVRRVAHWESIAFRLGFPLERQLDGSTLKEFVGALGDLQFELGVAATLDTWY